MRNNALNSAWRAATLVSAVLLGTGVKADDTLADARGHPFVVSGYLPWDRVEEWSPDEVGPVTDLIFFGVQLHALYADIL